MPRPHDTSRIAWAKLMARVGEKFPCARPGCGGDVRLRGDGRQEPAHFTSMVRAARPTLAEVPLEDLFCCLSRIRGKRRYSLFDRIEFVPLAELQGAR